MSQQQKQSTRRLDGRGMNTLRPLACEVATLEQADGSALWKSGKTHILAAVYGPVSPMIVQKEDADKSIVSVVIKGSATENNPQLHELSDFVQKILDSAIDTAKFPRCVVEVVLQIVQSDGSLLASLLHASVAALLDAGIDLNYTPVATTCLVVEENGGNAPQILLDSSQAEEEESNDSTVLVMVNSPSEADKLLGCHTIGTGVDLDTLLKCQQISAKACAAVPAFWRLVMEQKVTREAQTLWSR